MAESLEEEAVEILELSESWSSDPYPLSDEVSRMAGSRSNLATRRSTSRWKEYRCLAEVRFRTDLGGGGGGGADVGDEEEVQIFSTTGVMGASLSARQRVPEDSCW